MEGVVKTEETEAWHKPKNGSVFPAKKRSVKKMMWDQFVDPKGNNSSSNTVSPPPPQSSRANSTVHPS
ncbi:hypothetical protein MtrunA17_Chr3g0125361 [Medicago truncatula]|uniref:Uncharacterized protein n=1 Tax=Medicago truncatula TaxID=3880 RepID=A0A072V211_MEDTR|nr:hypothetical protein MTR_3g088705 [Medicago truncatula]RHN69496.1 hypothetical protein MtrunA17_Chr3g0125361 [Medicago truncatula]